MFFAFGCLSGSVILQQLIFLLAMHYCLDRFASNISNVGNYGIA